MNTDGDFEFYRFIWAGADQGWDVYSYPAKHGIKITFKNEKPSAKEIKIIRNSWPRLSRKTPFEAKSILDKHSFTFGKWSLKEAQTVLEKISLLDVKAEVVEVPDYLIVNMKTREAAQIRSNELYDLVARKLIENGGEVAPHSGNYPSGAIEIESEAGHPGLLN